MKKYNWHSKLPGWSKRSKLVGTVLGMILAFGLLIIKFPQFLPIWIVYFGIIMLFLVIVPHGKKRLQKLYTDSLKEMRSEKKYNPPIKEMTKAVLLISLPLYSIWTIPLFVAFMGSFYFFLYTGVPLFLVSYLSLSKSYAIWTDMEASGWKYWRVHLCVLVIIVVLISVIMLPIILSEA